MNFKSLFTFSFLACACFFAMSFMPVEARSHCGGPSLSVNFGVAPAPQTYVVQQCPAPRPVVVQAVPCQPVPCQPVRCAPVVAYPAPAPCYQEVVVVPSRPAPRAGFSFGWFFR